MHTKMVIGLLKRFNLQATQSIIIVNRTSSGSSAASCFESSGLYHKFCCPIRSGARGDQATSRPIPIRQPMDKY